MRAINNRNYVLAVLTIILLFNCVDRLALGLLLQNIKADLVLSDTQLGFLSGIAFALFYAVMGVPIARWADRGNRVTIICVTTLLWSVAVALSGLATNFTQLVLIRIAVAVGEAGCIPPAFALLADYFDRAERPRAAAIYGLGGPLSTLVGYFLAGWLNQIYGWRITFALLGAPGVALAAWTWMTLRDPRYPQRGTREAFASAPTVQEKVDSQPQPTMKEVYRTLWASVTFRHLLACLAVLFFFNNGIWMWLPAFLIRSYGLSTTEVGMWLAVVCGSSGLLGVYLGGELATRHAAHKESLQLKAVAASIVAGGFLMVLVYLSHNYYLAFALMALVAVGLSIANGPVFATIQTLVPERMRAVTFALVYLVANLIGMGFGPLAAGVMSDVLRPWFGDESLRYALLTLSPGYFVVAWFAWRASKTVSRDLASAQIEETNTRVAEHERVVRSSQKHAPMRA